MPTPCRTLHIRTATLHIAPHGSFGVTVCLGCRGSAEFFGGMMLKSGRYVGTGRFEETGPMIVIGVPYEKACASPAYGCVRLDLQAFCDLGQCEEMAGAQPLVAALELV